MKNRIWISLIIGLTGSCNGRTMSELESEMGSLINDNEPLSSEISQNVQDDPTYSSGTQVLVEPTGYNYSTAVGKL